MKRLVCLAVISAAVTICGSASAQQAPQTDGAPSRPRSPASEKPRLKRVHVNLSGFELSPKPLAGGISVQVSGGTRGGTQGPSLYAPRRGQSYTTTPTFYWEANDAHDGFQLTIYDSNETVVYQTSVQGNIFTYPTNANALRPGTVYSWTVQSKSALLCEPAQPVQLVLISSDERNSIDQTLKHIVGDSMAHQIRRAETFVNARLWYDSVTAYSDLISKYPDRAEFYDRRGEIYDQIPVTAKLADGDFQQADKLRMHQRPN